MKKETLYGPKDGLELVKREGGNTTVDAVYVVKVDGYERHVCETRAKGVELLIEEIESQRPVAPQIEFCVMRYAEVDELAEVECILSTWHRAEAEAALLDGYWMEAISV
jgi:hypothetical protein